jgi:hypothetical protein
MWNSYNNVRYRVQCSIIEASLGRYATHQYITFLFLSNLLLRGNGLETSYNILQACTQLFLCMYHTLSKE